MALILCDLNNKKSYKSAQKWKKELKKACKRYGIDDFPFVLVMNKSDVLSSLKRLPHSFQTEDYINKFVKKQGFVAGVKVSCKTGYNFIKLLEIMSSFGGDNGSTAATSVLMKGSLKLSVKTFERSLKLGSLKSKNGVGLRRRKEKVKAGCC